MFGGVETDLGGRKVAPLNMTLWVDKGPEQLHGKAVNLGQNGSALCPSFPDLDTAQGTT
jgi:hypothetical protein